MFSQRKAALSALVARVQNHSSKTKMRGGHLQINARSKMTLARPWTMFTVMVEPDLRMGGIDDTN
jgi:hypothetical protein